MIYMILSGIYIGALLLSPIFNTKIAHIGSWEFLAWTLMIPILSGVMDTINNNFGKTAARWTLGTALIVRMIFYLGIFPLIFLLPSVRNLGVDELFKQSFRNFLVSQGMTFIGRYYVEIPVFAKVRGWFVMKYGMAGAAFTVFKGVLQTFLMYVGVEKVQIWSLVATDSATKYGVLMVGSPFGIILNKIVKRCLKNRPNGK
jgi:uncharacterized PurR-regulated membrane protein YhhQ (DUF165 family)